ncbi:hypothetical protein HMPREF9120_01712 [Neisseria sp. oral taxon 020 str. F0370]|nr:hypothetical protein HMPREF9120_01712 [Neisseria sp. oral taxon 020 str. F0370]
MPAASPPDFGFALGRVANQPALRTKRPSENPKQGFQTASFCFGLLLSAESV